MVEPGQSRRQYGALIALALGTAAPGVFAQPTPADAPQSTRRSDHPASPVASAPTLAASAGAPPRDPSEPGAELRRKGNQAWQEGRFGDALAAYEEAVKLSPEAKTFFNLAVTYEKVGRYADALTWFSRYKSSASRKELDMTPSLDRRIAMLRTQVAVLKVHVNPVGARVMVRGEVVGTQAVDRPLEVLLNPGRADVEVVHEGYRPYYKEHTLKGGSVLELDVQLSRVDRPTTVIEKTNSVYVTQTPLWSRWWFWTGVSVVVVGGAATVFTLANEKPPSEKGVATIVKSSVEPKLIHLAFTF